MGGLLLLGILGGWLLVTGLVARWAARLARSKPWRAFIAPTVFLFVLVLPFVDEVIGGRQFQHLCKTGTNAMYDQAKARGRTVYMRQVPHGRIADLQVTPSRIVPGFIPITERSIDWLDVETNEVLLSYKTYTASGGWLIRALKLSETNSPLTFDPASCGFNELPVFKDLGITYR